MRLQLLKIFILGVTGLFLNPATSADLIAWWKLEEGSGNVTTTEIISGVTSNSFPDNWSTNVGAPGSNWSLGFDNAGFGTNLDSSIGFNGSEGKTIMAWFNTTATSQDAIFGYSPTGGNEPGAGLRFIVNGGSGLILEVNGASGDYNPPQPLNDGQWHMVAVVIRPGDHVRDVEFYVDGTLALADGPMTFPINTGVGGQIFLGNDGLGFRGFSGLLDDVAIFDTALRHDQLIFIQNMGVIPEPSTTGLALMGVLAGCAMGRRRCHFKQKASR